MSKTISDEKIKMSIVINGNEAQKELLDLENATRNLTKENKELNAVKKTLELQGKKNTDEYRKLTAEIKANNAVITANKDRMKVLQNEIGLTGLTMKQLKEKAVLLRLSLINAIPGGADEKRYRAELKLVEARLDELKVKAANTKMSLGTVADGFNRYAALAASAIAAGTGLVLSVQKIIDINGKLSDAQSDVMKTTGMSKKEVDELTKSFGMMKTRTARIELLGLATEAGRLGIEGVANVKAFVNQANKIKVALGDELSDEAIRSVGKMVNIYKVGEATGKDFGGAMDALGSSINAVSASGANQASFLVDYLERQAGIAAQVKLSAADNIGYAATFDELGQSVEVSATAMNKIWIDMAKNPSDYAKVAKMSVGDFNQLLKKDANEAMIQFLIGLNQGGEGLQLMTQKLEGLEVGGTRGIAALTALAGGTDLLRKRQATANEELIKATSLTNEYNLKNNNLAATLEKVKKTMMGWFSSESFINGLTSMVNWFAKLIGATDDADGSGTKWRNGLIVTMKIIAILLTALFSYNTALKLNAAWTDGVIAATYRKVIADRVHLLMVSLQAVALTAYTSVMGFFGIATDKATASLARLNTVTKLSPWGLLLSVIAAVVAAIVLFSENTDKAARTQKMFNEVANETNKQVAQETANLTKLLAVARDEKVSREARLQAIKDINEIAPEYLGNITLENINTQETTQAIDTYVENLRKSAEAKALASKLSELYSLRLSLEGKSLEDNISWYERLWNTMSSGGNAFAQMVKNNQTATENRKKEMEAIDAQINAIINKQKENYVDTVSSNVTVKTTTTTTTGTTPTDKEKSAAEKLKEELKKLAEEKIKIFREAEDAILANMQEGYDKERQLAETNYSRKIEDLRARLITGSEIEAAQKKAHDAKLSAADRQMWKAKADAWLENNKHIHSLIESEATAHRLKLGAIQETEWKRQIEKNNESYEQGKIARETAFNNELAALGNNEKRKEELTKKFKEQELKEDEKHLKEVLKQIESIQASMAEAGFDMKILTPEQVEYFKNLSAQLKKELSEIATKKGEISGNASDDKAKADLKSIGANVDILGFSADQWQTTFDSLDTVEEKLMAGIMAVQALTQAWGMYNQFVEANEKRQLTTFERNTDTKKRRLKNQLDTGAINQDQYAKATEKLDADLAKKKAEIEYKQAKRQKAMALANVATSTALAIMGIWAQFPKFDFGATAAIMSGVVGALGMAQAALILRQPLPAKGFEQGYYPIKREQDGKIFNAKYGGNTTSGLVTSPTYFLAGEYNKPEMIIDNKAWKEMAPEVKLALIRELRGIKGFEQGYYQEKVLKSANTSTTAQDDANQHMLQLMVKVIADNTAVMKEIKETGLLAIVSNKDYKSMRNLDEGIKNYQDLRKNNKV